MKLLQLNTTVNSGSTGRIEEDIGLTVMAAGHQSHIAAGVTNCPSQSEVIPIGSHWDRNLHGVKARLFDGHGFVKEVYVPFTGYGEKDLSWHEGKFNPYGWMLESIFAINK